MPAVTPAPERDLTHPSHWTGGIGVPFPKQAWKLEDGALTTSGISFRSLYSKEPFEHFDLSFEWKIAPGANTGVKYLCAPGMLDPDWQASVQNAPYLIGGLLLFAAFVPAVAWLRLRRTWVRWALSVLGFLALLGGLASAYLLYQARSRIALTPPGFEYQIIDDNNYRVRLRPEQKTGSLYDLLAAPPTPEPIAGRWHQSRIVVAAEGVEHWLDGERVLTFRMGSDQLAGAVAKSKFRRVEGFANPRRGHLQLQAHDGQVWFRNIRIREINSAESVPPPSPATP
jgi:hypothetical protein